MRSLNFMNCPLGLVNPYVPMKKEWIGAAIGAVAGIASSLIGGSEASRAARAAEERQRKQEAKENAYYNRRYNEDYVDTAAGQNLVRRAKEYAKENWRKAAGAAAVSGATDASTQMAKDAGNKMVGDTLANIAATDQMRKDRADAQHMAAQNQFAQMDMNREMQRAQNITSAAQQASNAIMQAGSAIDGATSLSGGSNKSTETTATPKTTQQIEKDMGINAKAEIESNVSPVNVGTFGSGTEQQLRAMRNKIAPV